MITYYQVESFGLGPGRIHLFRLRTRFIFQRILDSKGHETSKVVHIKDLFSLFLITLLLVEALFLQFF